MAQDEFENVNLTVKIDNFNGRKRCPYCGEMPKEMEWSSEGLRIWCREKKCDDGRYPIFVPIYPEEIDLVKVTREVIEEWGKYCDGIKRVKREIAKKRAELA